MEHTDVARWRPALEVGVELGAKYVLVVGNDSDQMRLVDNFARLCSLCAEYHLRPMLEFIPYAEIGTLADAAALIEQSAASNPGILVDSIHLSRSGGKPGDLGTYDLVYFPMRMSTTRQPHLLHPSSCGRSPGAKGFTPEMANCG